MVLETTVMKQTEESDRGTQDSGYVLDPDGDLWVDYISIY